MRTVLLMVTIFAGSDALAGEWERLPTLPDKEGFAGPFGGVSNGTLLVAGGANFPDKKPWDGGKKVWYDSVFVLEKPDEKWKNAGKLPRPLGYGVSVTHGDGVVCVGGSDADRHYADAFRLEWKTGKLVTTKIWWTPMSRPKKGVRELLFEPHDFWFRGVLSPGSCRTRRNQKSSLFMHLGGCAIV